MNESVLRLIVSDLHKVADRLELDGRETSRDSASQMVRQVADKITDFKVKASPAETMEIINQLKDCCRVLHQLSKKLAGTKFETDLRVLAIKLTNSAPLLMKGIVDSIPGSSLLSCRVKNTNKK